MNASSSVRNLRTPTPTPQCQTTNKVSHPGACVNRPMPRTRCIVGVGANSKRRLREKQTVGCAHMTNKTGDASRKQRSENNLHPAKIDCGPRIRGWALQPYPLVRPSPSCCQKAAPGNVGWGQRCVLHPVETIIS